MWTKFMKIVVNVLAVVNAIAAIVAGYWIGSFYKELNYENGVMYGLLAFGVILIVGYVMIGVLGVLIEAAEHIEHLEIQSTKGLRYLESICYNSNQNVGNMPAMEHKIAEKPRN